MGASGGQLEEGESPREAAWRELHEETGQRPDVLTFAGVVTFALGLEQRQEHAAVYTGTVSSEGDFVVNREIERIIWWDPDGASVEGLSTALDAEIARRTRQSR
ncbi:MAG: NUDIX domain-containing protein [Dermatophilaceae bacterium]